MVAVSVVCFALAGAITLKTIRAKRPNLERFEGRTTWVKCRNPNCKAVYQMNLKDCLDYIIKHKEPGSRTTPALICKECGEPSAYRAIKCEECGFVFELGSTPRDFEDRCPKCGYSKKEQER